MDSIEEAVTAIKKVLNLHENHLTPGDIFALECAKEHLLVMKRQGFK